MLVVAPVVQVVAAGQIAFAVLAGPPDALPPNSLIRLRGLPDGVTPSEGVLTAKGTWSVPLAAAIRLKLNVPSGLSARSDFLVSLVDSNGSALVEQPSALVLAGADGRRDEGSGQAEATSRERETRLAITKKLEEMRFEAEKAEAQRKAEEARRNEETRKAEEARLAAVVKKLEEMRLETERVEAEWKAQEARKAEAARKAEEERLAVEARRAEELRSAAAKAEAARKAEEARLAAEARKVEELRAAAAKAEAVRKSEEARLAEEARKAEVARKDEEARLAAEAKKVQELRAAAEKAEAQRKAEEERLAEIARKAEQARQAAEAHRAEEQSIAAERAVAARKAEETRKADEARKAEEQRIAAEARKAEELRIAAEKADAARKAEEARLAEESKKAEGVRLAAHAQGNRASQSPSNESVVGREGTDTPAGEMKSQPPNERDGSAQAERLLVLGDRYLAQGNVVVARQYFLRAADLGNASGALRLAETHDPLELSRLGVVGVTPDPEQAQKWYRKAIELGALEAQAKLQRLAGQ